MKRSAGVTAAAVIALLGSACFGVLCIFELFGALLILRHGPSNRALPEGGPIPAATALIMGVITNLGFAGWGLATGIGLIRLKPWSRISTLVFASLLAVFTGFGAVIVSFVPFPQVPNASHAFSGAFRTMIELFFAVPFSVSAWWLILFTRKSVAAQFSEPAIPAVSGAAQTPEIPATFVAGPRRAQRPLIITILAWFFLVSGISTLPSLFLFFLRPWRNMAFPFFGFALEGRILPVYSALLAVLLLAAGIALLKNKVWGFWLALAIHLFKLLNMGTSIFLPGRADRFQKMVASMSVFPSGVQFPPNFFVTMMMFGLGAGLVISIIVLCLLLFSGRRFLKFAAIQAQAIPSAG